MNNKIVVVHVVLLCFCCDMCHVKLGCVSLGRVGQLGQLGCFGRLGRLDEVR